MVAPLDFHALVSRLPEAQWLHQQIEAHSQTQQTLLAEQELAKEQARREKVDETLESESEHFEPGSQEKHKYDSPKSPTRESQKTDTPQPSGGRFVDLRV